METAAGRNDEEQIRELVSKWISATKRGELESRSVELQPRQGFVVPKGVIHRTRAPERAVILMVENAGIVPTGDA